MLTEMPLDGEPGNLGSHPRSSPQTSHSPSLSPGSGMPVPRTLQLHSCESAVWQQIGKDNVKARSSVGSALSLLPSQNQKDPGVLDRMMKKLDVNCDGQLDFQEFLNLIGGLAVACHDSFTASRKYV